MFKRNYYKIKYFCDNCDKFFKVKIPKGTRFIGYEWTCPYCGVKDKLTEERNVS